MAGSKTTPTLALAPIYGERNNDTASLPAAPGDRVQEVLDYQATRLRREKYPSKTKTLVSIRIDNDVIDHFKHFGDDWKVRMNEALRKATGLDGVLETGD